MPLRIILLEHSLSSPKYRHILMDPDQNGILLVIKSQNGGLEIRNLANCYIRKSLKKRVGYVTLDDPVVSDFRELFHFINFLPRTSFQNSLPPKF
jgi:hypothetical protein